MENSVTNWLDHIADAMPGKLAIYDENRSISYGEYRKKSLAIAREILLFRNRKKSDGKIPVAIYLKKGLEVPVSFLGVAYAGGFYSPIDISMPKERVIKILGVLLPKLVITTEELKKNFQELGYQGEFLIYENILSKEGDAEIVREISDRIIDTDLLYVLFTSGSTGIPKGVAIRHKSVVDYIDWVTETFNISREDSFGNQAPFYFDNSVLDIYSCIKTGATMYIIPPKLFSQPLPLLSYIKDHGINSIFWVPSALMIVSSFKTFRKVELQGVLKRVLFCGEVMPNKHLNIWREYLPDVVYANLYGPTEITDACTYYIVDREFDDGESLPIGFPMKNTDILLLDENDSPTIEGEVGELCVRGTCLAAGYYNDKKRTDEVFVQNPLNNSIPEKIYKTGDLVKFNERGELIFLSRKDFQIKHLGHRIELGEIETAAATLDGTSFCCCLYDEKHSMIVLFIDCNLSMRYVREKLGKMLPEYMLPGKLVYLEKMPMNINGKIDRARLKDFL